MKDYKVGDILMCTSRVQKTVCYGHLYEVLLVRDQSFYVINDTGDRQRRTDDHNFYKLSRKGTSTSKFPGWF